jgi:hypothetical protein
MIARFVALKKEPRRVLEVLAEYDAVLDTAEENLRVGGKTLEKANRENASWMVYYDQRRIELQKLSDFFQSLLDRKYSVLYKSYKEGYSRELGERSIDKYIQNDEEYLALYELLLDIKEVLMKYESFVEAFKARGYALNNITRARVASVHDYTIE